jgi:galactokinase
MQDALIARFREVFGEAPEFVARAPGRIEFIGNHTDYNGGPVLGAAVNRNVWVGLRRRADGVRRYSSPVHEGLIVREGAPERAEGGEAWINYPQGVLAALPEFGLPVPGGFDYLAMADLPAGAGMSSSAAIELASALVFIAAMGREVDRTTLVKIGRHAENHFVGVPCGILDQGVSGFGRADHLVHIDCRGPSFRVIPLPPRVHCWIFNTHTKHALVDGLYAARHRECMAAAAALGVEALVDADLARLDAARGGMDVTVYRRARHVVEEIARVHETCAALAVGDLGRVGELLTASHRSSRDQFENSTPELDLLVDTLVATPGVYGARLTGGGFGGAVMALTAPDFEDGARAVAQAYLDHYRVSPEVLHLQVGAGAELVVAP